VLRGQDDEPEFLSVTDADLRERGARLPMMKRAGELLARHRQNCALRFTGAADWLRLTSLGTLIMTFSAIALADVLSPEPLPGHFGGSAALFAGTVTAMVVVKLEKGGINLEWISFAMCSIGIGTVLYVDEQISEFASLLLISLFLALSSLTRFFIGLTASPQTAADWIFVSGYITALGGFLIVAAWIMRLSASPPTIITLDCLFQGISIMGFGLSLREAS
jgi:uncharacterized membrane protein HdeD (DUF308 family)